MPEIDNKIGRDRPILLRIATFLLLTCATLWCAYWFVHAWHYWEDDAYIHLEFARSVAAGQGFSFNGRLVSGDTAPLWVLLLDSIHALIPDWIVAGKVLTAIGAAFGLGGIYAFARGLARVRPFPYATVFPAATVLLVVANPCFCYWAFSGMETITAAGLACWAVLIATRKQHLAKNFLGGCFLAGIAPLLRPEMLFLSGLITLPLFRQWNRLPARPAKRALAFVGPLLLLAPQALWLVYSVRTFGHILPNTNAAKRATTAISVVYHLFALCWTAFPVIGLGLILSVAYLILRPMKVYAFLWNTLLSAFEAVPQNPPGVAPSRSTAPPAPNRIPLAAWIFVLWSVITAVFYIANHTYVQSRYIFITTTGLTVVVIFLLFRASRRFGLTLYLVSLASVASVSVITVRPFIRNKEIDCEATRNMALYIHDNVPPNAPVAVYSIGEIAFVSQHPIIDTGGITRPGAIPYLNDDGLDRIVSWARLQGAEYYIETHQPEPGAVPVYAIDMKRVGWSLHSELYTESASVTLWKLPAASPPPSQSASVGN